VQEIDTRERNGKWKVSRSCVLYLEERRLYHRKDGEIVKLRDDVLSAARYGTAAALLERLEESAHHSVRPACHGQQVAHHAAVPVCPRWRGMWILTCRRSGKQKARAWMDWARASQLLGVVVLAPKGD
jgi:hypothetical protein